MTLIVLSPKSHAQIAEHFKGLDEDSDGKLTLVELMAKSSSSSSSLLSSLVLSDTTIYEP